VESIERLGIRMDNTNCAFFNEVLYGNHKREYCTKRQQLLSGSTCEECPDKVLLEKGSKE
jgi:hypothetical protein